MQTPFNPLGICVKIDRTPITFNYTGSFQEYIVPIGVYSIHVDCVASKGYGDTGGKGGRVDCDLAVKPKTILYLWVGTIPETTESNIYNASDIRTNNTGITDTTSLQSRILVAGAGGNESGRSRAGGDGGDLIGADGGNGYGGNSAGKGGTQIAGGEGGAGTPVSVGHYHNGNPGELGLGGIGSVCTLGNYEGPSGAGGAGYYGGGSGAADWNRNGGYTAGGGGGSSYTNSSCSNVKHTQGYNNGVGYITITPN